MMRIPTRDKEGKYTARFRSGIHKARLDLANGNTISFEEAKKRLGL